MKQGGPVNPPRTVKDVVLKAEHALYHAKSSRVGRDAHMAMAQMIFQWIVVIISGKTLTLESQKRGPAGREELRV